MDPLAAQQQQAALITSGMGGLDLSSENVLTGRGRLERGGVHGSGQLAVEQGSDQQKQAGGEDNEDAQTAKAGDIAVGGLQQNR